MIMIIIIMIILISNICYSSHIFIAYYSIPNIIEYFVFNRYSIYIYIFIYMRRYICLFYIEFIFLSWQKISKGYFHSRDPAMSLRGGLTSDDGADCRGAVSASSSKTVTQLEQECRPTHLDERSPIGCSPLPRAHRCAGQMTLPPLQMLPRPSPRGAKEYLERHAIHEWRLNGSVSVPFMN